VADGLRFHGSTSAVEEGVAWSVGYEIEVDERWHTRRARITGRSPSGERSLEVLADGDGNWVAGGVERPELAGYLDIDLESSAFTNALPMHRLGLAIGAAAEAPAAYVRADGLTIERVEQRYERIADRRYDYRAPAFDFRCELAYDEHGLVLDYPGIAVRVA